MMRIEEMGQECQHPLLCPRQLDEAFQLPDPRRVAHFPQGFCFDLADPLAGDLELTADFLKRTAVAVLEAEALFKDFTLTFG